MDKIIRIGKIEDQDAIRQGDLAEMSPDMRLASMVNMQSNFLRWDLNPRIKRTGNLKRKNFKNVY